VKLGTKVKKLKDKHRNRVWRDSDGDLWYYDPQLLRWTVLLHENGDTIGFQLDPDWFTDTPDGYGPFKSVAGYTVEE
jgi:hypothetical protein